MGPVHPKFAQLLTKVPKRFVKAQICVGFVSKPEATIFQTQWRRTHNKCNLEVSYEIKGDDIGD